jgi:SMI1-KNR4 cell-wall
MWRELIQSLTADCEFSDPVTPVELRNAELALGVSLPTDLRGLMCESNGVFAEYKLGLVWPLERIVNDNLSFRRNADFRELYMPFDHLLFFADAGNGDQFAFAIKGGVVCQD